MYARGPCCVALTRALRARRAPTEWLCLAARAACVSTWLGGLLPNHSPARSHSKTITRNPNPNPSPESRRCPELNHNPNLSPNPNPNEQFKFVQQCAAHGSRDLDKSSFSPITPQGCIFTLRHMGCIEISVEKYVGSFPRNTKTTIFNFSTGV